MSSFISEKERLLTIEDAAELQLQQPHVGRMETRPPSIEGKGEIRQRDLVKNALRMRPDRVILGECRGEEAFDMLQAMNTGHEGSMATVHANTPRDAVSRLGADDRHGRYADDGREHPWPDCSSHRVIVQLSRLSDGKRRVMSIAEITGLEGDIIRCRKSTNSSDRHRADGSVQGHFQATGIRPRFLTDLVALGIEVPGSYSIRRNHCDRTDRCPLTSIPSI